MKVYTQGSYEIFKLVHVNFLRRSASYGKVYIGLISDKSFEDYRGYPPINSFNHRRAVLKSCEYVSWVEETYHNDTKDDLDVLNPDVIAIGTDWVSKDVYKQWGVTPEMIDDKLIYIPYTTDISTTIIKRKVNEANKV